MLWSPETAGLAPPAILFLALMLDALVGEFGPLFRILPHPVALMGGLIGWFDRRLNREQPYSVIVTRISALELEIVRLKDDIHMNSEFRIKWPRGELGALPADARQDLRLDIYEKEIDKLKTIVDDLRFETTP